MTAISQEKNPPKKAQAGGAVYNRAVGFSSKLLRGLKPAAFAFSAPLLAPTQRLGLGVYGEGWEPASKLALVLWLLRHCLALAHGELIPFTLEDK